MKTTSVVALLVLSLLASLAHGQSPYEYRTDGAVVGGLLGAVTGGALGNTKGKALPGALIGGAVGALTGAAVGDSIDNKVARNNAIYEQRLAAQAQATQAVSLQDVMSMSQARLSDNVIITQIRTRGVLARPQPNDLIALSQAGVSDAVIAAMQTAPLATVPVVSPTYPTRVVQEHVYVTPSYPPPVYFYYGAPYHRHYYPPPPPPHRYAPGVHWGITIGR